MKKKKQYAGETTHFSLGGTIAKTMTENFKEIKVACSSIFMRIFMTKFITDSWGMIDKTDGF